MNRNVPRILCVDDELMNLILLDAMLSPCGYEIVQASCGAEALELMETERFDLCLLDVMMPGIDGFEVCRRIKAAGGQRQIPVVLAGRRPSCSWKTSRPCWRWPRRFLPARVTG
jgi:CheY-like chemotaxis protein